MNSKIIKYGAISGLIIIGILFITSPFWEDSEKTSGFEWLGYLVMVISLSLIFFGVKSFRDRQLNGKITFWNALKMGLGITLVAGVFYVGGWEIYYQSSAQNFIEQYTDSYLKNMEEEGASEVEINDKKSELKEYQEMYVIWYYRYIITLLELLPVGVVISLISAITLRKGK